MKFAPVCVTLVFEFSEHCITLENYKDILCTVIFQLFFIFCIIMHFHAKNLQLIQHWINPTKTSNVLKILRACHNKSVSLYLKSAPPLVGGSSQFEPF